MSDPNARTIYNSRICFSRSGAAIWLGHLDMMRTFERSLLRAGLPVSYSLGFNPRPELVFALPAGVGITTERDYLDLALTAPRGAAEITARLQAALPADIRVLAVQNLPAKTKNLMGLVKEADYRLEFPGAAALAAPVTAAASLVIERTAKGRTRRQDIRPLLLRVEPGKHPDALSLRCLAGSAQNLRMDSFCSALHRYFGVEPAILEDAEQIREEIYILWEGALIPPLPLP